MFARPTDGRIASPFGWRTIGGQPDFHAGIDFAAPYGTPIRAWSDGRVIGVYANGQLNRYGLAVVLEHPADPSPLFSLYGHLSESLVDVGDAVDAGEVIVLSGDSAGTREDPSKTVGPHTHFEILTRWPPSGIDQDRIDPAPYLPGSSAGASAGAAAGAAVAAAEAKRARAVRGRRRTTAAAAGGGGVALLLLLLAMQYKKTRRPRVTAPALDHPTEPSDQWAE